MNGLNGRKLCSSLFSRVGSYSPVAIGRIGLGAGSTVLGPTTCICKADRPFFVINSGKNIMTNCVNNNSFISIVRQIGVVNNTVIIIQ